MKNLHLILAAYYIGTTALVSAVPVGEQNPVAGSPPSVGYGAVLPASQGEVFPPPQKPRKSRRWRSTTNRDNPDTSSEGNWLKSRFSRDRPNRSTPGVATDSSTAAISSQSISAGGIGTPPAEGASSEATASSYIYPTGSKLPRGRVISSGRLGDLSFAHSDSDSESIFDNDSGRSRAPVRRKSFDSMEGGPYPPEGTFAAAGTGYIAPGQRKRSKSLGSKETGRLSPLTFAP